MGQKEKLIKKLKSVPKDMTFEEAVAYFKERVPVTASRFYQIAAEYRSNKGKTSGSRVLFSSDSHPPILLHKPHPRKELLAYQIKQLIEILEQEGLI